MKYDFVTDKIKNIPFSGIRKFFDVAEEMKDVVSLGVGEPDFLTPWSIREAAIYNLENGRTIYSSNTGLAELRQEIAIYQKRKYNLTYDYKTQVIVTVGGSEAIDLALRAVINEGDEVLIHEPSFVSYKPCILLAGGIPVIIETKEENDFRLTKQELLEKITDRTKVLILSFPNNPTGAIMEKKDLEEIAEVIRDKNILVISDEIYSELNYGENDHVSIASIPGMYEKTVVINGFSKAFAMTGWRLGYALAPPDLLSAMLKIHQYAIMCAPTTAQYGGIEALKNCDDAVMNMKNDFNIRRRVMINGFRNMGLSVFEPLGAFYLFPGIKETGLTSEEFCNRMLYEEKVAVVPGTAFGDCGEGFIRCSYAYSIDQLHTAIERIGRFVAKNKLR